MSTIANIKEYTFKKVFFIYVVLELISITSAFLINTFVDKIDSSSIDRLLNSNSYPFLAFIVFPIMAFIEELLFRFIPIYLSDKIFKNINHVLIVQIFVNIGFGWIHGGVENIFIQGFGGFGYSMLYVWIHNKFGHHMAFSFTTLLHYIHNLILISLYFYFK